MMTLTLAASLTFGLIGLVLSFAMVGDELIFMGVRRTRRALAIQSATAMLTLGCYSGFGICLWLAAR